MAPPGGFQPVNTEESEFSDESTFTSYDNFVAEHRKLRSWKTVAVVQSLLVGVLIAAVALVGLQSVELAGHYDERLYCEMYSSKSVRNSLNLRLAPAQDVLRRKDIVFTNGFGRGRTAYMGPPSPERDQAWEDLYQCKSIHLLSTGLAQAD
jgi:hypothetical protein